MKEYIEERAVEIACYIIEHKATVRQAAGKFGVSKSTIHKDVTERLIQINPSLAMQARKVLVVANGLAKAKAVKLSFPAPVTPECPGSILQMHPDFILVGDEEALSEI